ncbi:MAG: hypothetical protein DRN04_12515 [Thermoprotei archaeon]|nr:MAG: hypothetical protein DRN04_12515 [Thermoprotei archaeon]
MTKVSLPKFIIEELKEKASRAGVTIEEYLLDILVRDIDPIEGASKYLKGAEELLEQARQELKKNDLRQASEKIWGACALAIKAHALAKKGVKLESHRDLWIYKNEVAKELGEWVRMVFRQADSMHKNFYENLATREDIEDVLKEVEKLVTTISKTIKRY